MNQEPNLYKSAIQCQTPSCGEMVIVTGIYRKGEIAICLYQCDKCQSVTVLVFAPDVKALVGSDNLPIPGYFLAQEVRKIIVPNVRLPGHPSQH